MVRIVEDEEKESIPELQLRVDAVSSQEWSYVHGLYLADGYALRKTRNYTVRFFLQGNEIDIARKLTELLRKTGLNPHIAIAESGEDDITVRACSRQLTDFLPCKKDLLENVTLREKYFEGRNLYDVDEGIPFLAGLLDGDGSCPVKVDRRRSFKGILNKWCWSFVQARLPFLVDYVVEFLDSFAPEGVSIEAHGDKRKRTVHFRKSGITALLDLGIDKHSIKVAKWLERVARLQRHLAAYHTVGEVARMLDVSGGTVLNWIKAGKLASNRRIENSPGRYPHYISHVEFSRFAQELLQNKKMLERAKMAGSTVLEVAKLLVIRPRTLRKWLQCGKVKGCLLREGSHEYYVIPREEVSRLVVKKRQRSTIEERKQNENQG